jgi:chitinase
VYQVLKKLSPPLLMLPCLIATSVHALETENNFSPYADLTINTQWDSHYQDMEPVDLFAISQSTGVKSFHLAFITDAGNCQPAWGAQSAYSINSGWASHLTDKLRANNLKTIVSFGGASGNYVSKDCYNYNLISTY